MRTLLAILVLLTPCICLAQTENVAHVLFSDDNAYVIHNKDRNEVCAKIFSELDTIIKPTDLSIAKTAYCSSIKRIGAEEDAESDAKKAQIAYENKLQLYSEKIKVLGHVMKNNEENYYKEKNEDNKPGLFAKLEASMVDFDKVNIDFENTKKLIIKNAELLQNTKDQLSKTKKDINDAFKKITDIDGKITTSDLLLECKNPKEANLDAQSIVASIKSNNCNRNKITDGTGKAIGAIVVTEKTVNIKFKETDKDAQIIQDAGTLLTALQKAFGGIAEDKKGLKMFKSSYTIASKRSDIEIKVVENDKDLAKTTVSNGPEEHFYISADVSLTKIKKKSFNKDDNTLKNEDLSTPYYFGINYMFGDITSNTNYWWQNIVIKSLFKISEKPYESMGIAIGSRKIFNVETNLISPYVGVVWTLGDNIENGASKTNSKYYESIIAGISLNIDKAADLVKPKK